MGNILDIIKKKFRKIIINRTILMMGKGLLHGICAIFICWTNARQRMR